MHRNIKRFAVAAILLPIALVTGCGARTSTPTPSPIPATGTLGGQMIRVGGALGTPNQPLSGIIKITSDGVTIKVPVGANGFFFVDLAPGSYAVVGQSRGVGNEDCPVPGVTVIRSFTITRVTVICNII